MDEQQAEARRSLAERNATDWYNKKRVANRVISPPLTEPLQIRDASSLFVEAQSHLKDGNVKAATVIYRLIIRASVEPRHQQAARNLLKPLVVDEMESVAVFGKKGEFAGLVSEYDHLKLYSKGEIAELKGLDPSLPNAEERATSYVNDNSKAIFRRIAISTLKVAPKMHADAIASTNRTIADARKKAFAAMAGARTWIPIADGCELHILVEPGSMDLVWNGVCVEGKVAGEGSYSLVGAGRQVLFSYKGSFNEGKIHGRAQAEWASGVKFEGNYENGMRQGPGILTEVNGDRYVGEFINDQLSGAGVYHYTDGRKFEGEFLGGKRYSGREFSADGRLLAICSFYSCLPPQ
ncbi:MORN repeat-containing protein [Acidovorax sp. sic0104]|uniref:MORN repeat-containing protein n=1 Tax=Acidovorax sp. sic0104 TaxID=2854784 RepID=UPI001C48C75A|nr:hypothetical protein [Acidovorax sp. sic0104]MBV7541977.1 hypothetical protein [Acidovorax sp. sic0104]